MSSAPPELGRVGFIGGTGPEGRGLASRLAAAGITISIGSRSAERGEETARAIRSDRPRAPVAGGTNAVAAATADLVVLTIPYEGIAGTLGPLARSLERKVVVSAIAPVVFKDGRPVALSPPAGSAAQEVQQALPDSRVVSAFQIIDAHQLQNLDAELDTDVIVCSDDTEARRLVMSLATRIPGVRALSGGRLATSRYVEECTALLITLNRIYKTHSGIRITNIKR
jgi:NADPH-dependent F420 reductase